MVHTAGLAIERLVKSAEGSTFGFLTRCVLAGEGWSISR
jgi:hypothetical protein